MCSGRMLRNTTDVPVPTGGIVRGMSVPIATGDT